MGSAVSGLILVADDNESARYHKVRTLRRVGYEVIEAASGEEALRVAAESAPRLIVLDINLPDMDGREVARRLKADDRTSSIVILQVSATHVRQEDTVMALDSGADASLTEPMDPTVLVATVGALLRARQAEEALRDALSREQIARSQAESANRAKDDFLAMLSHELRSPLGAILAWVTLLRSGQVDEEQSARGLEAIERSARQQVRLIEDLLDVSRITSGKLRLDISEVDLVAVVDAAVDSIRLPAEAKAIQVDVDVDEGLGRIAGDPGRLQQVVWNLLSNAVKFTPQDGRISSASWRAARRWSSTSAIRGGGSSRICSRTSSSASVKAARRRCARRAGSGSGSRSSRTSSTCTAGPSTPRARAWIVARRSRSACRWAAEGAAVEAVQHARAVVSEPASFPTLSGLRVLVLDDEPDTREAVSAVLEGCGAQVVAVAKVSEALAFLARGETDLVVSDVAMPVEDGYRFIAELRRAPAEHGATLPVLAFTAHAGAEERLRILEAGFDEFIAKPIEARDLVAAVARLAKRGRRP
jgi:CheY-like chemotaxis protein